MATTHTERVRHVYHEGDAGVRESSWGMVAAFVMVIGLVLLALYFVIPAIRSYSGNGINVNVPDRIQVETTVPAAPTGNTDGGTTGGQQ